MLQVRGQDLDSIMKGLFFSLIALVAFGSCAETTKEVGSSATDNIAQRITKDEFKSQMESLETFQLVDVRTPSEFSAGTIGDAINIDYNGDDFTDKINALDKSIPVLMFCQSGGRSAKALKIFADNEFTIVYELEGGYGNW